VHPDVIDPVVDEGQQLPGTPVGQLAEGDVRPLPGQAGFGVEAGYPESAQEVGS